LSHIYPLEWKSVLKDFNEPATEHLFIRVRDIGYETLIFIFLNKKTKKKVTRNATTNKQTNEVASIDKLQR
jgi:hypothetical protein